MVMDASIMTNCLWTFNTKPACSQTLLTSLPRISGLAWLVKGFLCQSQSIKTGIGDWSFKCEDIHAIIQRSRSTRETQCHQRSKINKISEELYLLNYFRGVGGELYNCFKDAQWTTRENRWLTKIRKITSKQNENFNREIILKK